MKVTNIDWDIDINEALEKLDEMTFENASASLGIPKMTYANMTTEELHDYARDLWHHSPATLQEFMELPDEVELPQPEGREEWDDETISEYLSNEYGFCHRNFDVERDGIDFDFRIDCTEEEKKNVLYDKIMFVKIFANDEIKKDLVLMVSVVADKENDERTYDVMSIMGYHLFDEKGSPLSEEDDLKSYDEMYFNRLDLNKVIDRCMEIDLSERIEKENDDYER